MGQERLDSLSLLYIEADILRSVDFEDVIKDFALAKSREKDFLNCVLHCNCNCMQQGCKRDLSLWISKQYRRPAFKMMYMQFCNEPKKTTYWLVNETLWYETETFDFQSETRSRPSHVSRRPRRLETTSRDRDVETETTSLFYCYACFTHDEGEAHYMQLQSKISVKVSKLHQFDFQLWHHYRKLSHIILMNVLPSQVFRIALDCN